MKVVLIVFHLIFAGVGATIAQDEGNCLQEVPKKAIKKYEKLKKKYSRSNSEVIESIKELIEEYPAYVEPVYFLAEHYKRSTFDMEKPHVKEKLIEKTIAYYEQSISICPAYSGYLAYYNLGIFHHKYKQAGKASAESFQKYLELEKEHPKRYKKIATDLSDEYFTKYRLLEHPVPYEPKVVKGVNGREDEYLPMLSPDNNYLYLTRKRTSPIDLRQPQKNGNDFNEYFIQSRRITVDSFSYGRIMGKPFNQFDEALGGFRLIGQGGACLTPDNKEMYLTLTVQELVQGTSVQNTSLYFTKLVDGEWQKIKSLGRNINDEKNEKTWEGQPTISADGKMMIFATARTTSTSFELGGEVYNSMDLYVVHKMTNGLWGVPKSLGEVINTPGNEKTPFLHTDSKTLYFASNGHPGMGGYDIFYTQLMDDGTWSKPVNIGYPINTEADEHGLVVSLDGKYAFMTSGISGNQEGGLDIIHFPLHPNARPEKVVFIKGTLESEDGKPVKNGKISIKDEATGEVHDALVDENTGEYVAVISVKDPDREQPPKDTEIIDLNMEEFEVPVGSKIAPVNGKDQIIPPGAEVKKVSGKDWVVEKGDQIKKVNGKETLIPKGHEIVVQNNVQKVVKKTADPEKKDKQSFIITATGENMAIQTESVELDPKEVDGAKKISGKKMEVKESKTGEPIRLNEVNFATNSYLLNSRSMLILDELIHYLELKPTMKITILGHTDNVGKSTDNLALSKERAKEVMNYLIDGGISQSRLKSEGYGDTKPKESNASEAGRAINRRVEFVIDEL